MPQKHLGLTKIFQLFPEGWEILREIENGPGLSVLASIVPNVDLQRGDDHRPIRLKIPNELDASIRQAIDSRSQKAEHKYIDVLLAAARRYREEHPLPKDWREPDQDAYAEAERERRQEEEPKLHRKRTVLRLAEEERELLQNLGRGRIDSITRHDALCELTEIVNDMCNKGELEEVQHRRRKSCRVNIPLDLKAAIDARVKKGDKFLTVLLAAAKEYQRKKLAGTGLT